MTSAEELMDLAEQAYHVDRLIQDPPLVIGERFTAGPEAHEQDYEVVDVEAHAANGFQAMAVAPVVEGVPDLSNIVVSYAGTNPEHRADILEDAETVVGITQGPFSQAADAQRFADRVSKAHPEASISTVGHSLGGFLALFGGGRARLGGDDVQRAGPVAVAVAGGSGTVGCRQAGRPHPDDELCDRVGPDRQPQPAPHRGCGVPDRRAGPGPVDLSQPRKGPELGVPVHRR